MFPRVNSALSAYLKNSRTRTGASVAIAIAAAAGVGTASATAGAGPWASSLNSLAVGGHSASDHAAASQTGTNVFHSVVPGKSGSPAPDSQSSGSRSGHQATAGQSQASSVQLADQQKPAAKPRQSSPGAAAPQALPKPAGAKVQHPAAPKKGAAPKKAAPKPERVAAPAKAAPSSPPKPYTLYDAVNPGSIPSGKQQVAVYGNGHFQASWSAVKGRKDVLWIDTNASDPGCDVLDVEPGDATPSAAAHWVNSRVAKDPGHPVIVYTMRSEWSGVKNAINGLPGSVRSHVQYWIADPTGSPHIVPGSSATQWYWGSNYDETSAAPGFGQ